jgi:hypothetical protein
MPTILRYKNYRLFFFSRENSEPIHVHIEKDDKYAKFWVEPITLSKSFGFRSDELSEIRQIIESNIVLIKTKWDEHFNNK